MSTVGPPVKAPPTVIATTPPLVTASVAQAGSSFSSLSLGTIINGSAVGQDAQGRVLLNTPQGNLTLTTNIAIPPGSTVTLQVQSVGTQLQMVLLSINNQPPQAAGGTGETGGTGGTAPGTSPAGAAPAPGTSPAGAATAAAATARQPAVVTSGSVLTASLVGTFTGGALGHLTGAMTGTFPAPTANMAPPQAASAQAPGTQTPSAATATPAASATGPPAAGGGAAASVAQGSQLNVRIVAIEPAFTGDPAALLQTAAASRPAGTPLIAGTVTGANTLNQPYIQTPIGLLSLSARAPLPQGSLVILEVLGISPRPQAPAVPAAVGTEARLLALGREWPALTEAIAALARIDSAAAQHVLNNVIPRPGTNMANSILFLFAALQLGKFTQWFGNMAGRALELGGRGKLLERLTDEFSQLSRLAREPVSGEWRTFLIPIFDGRDINPVRLFMKKGSKKKKDGEDEESDTRFLFDIELSKLGSLQFDGLVRSTIFDLIIRSHKRLPQEVREDILAIFHDSLEATKFSGEINFRVTREFITPLSPELTVKKAPQGSVGFTV